MTIVDNFAPHPLDTVPASVYCTDMQNTTRSNDWHETDPTWWTVSAIVTDSDGTNPRRVRAERPYYGVKSKAISALVRHIDQTNTKYFIERVDAKVCKDPAKALAR